MHTAATINSRKMVKRAWLTAHTVAHGLEMFDFIAKPETRALLVAQAQRGLPPVMAISQALFDRFGKVVLRPTLKQCVGVIVRAVLYEEGYRVAEKGIRLKNDPIFRTASIYEPVGNPRSAKSRDLVEAMFSGLTEQQGLRVASILESSHPGLLRKALASVD